MAQDRLSTPRIFIRTQLSFAGCLLFVTSSGISAFHRPSQDNLCMLESDGKTFGNLRIIEGDQFDEHQGLSCYAHGCLGWQDVDVF